MTASVAIPLLTFAIVALVAGDLFMWGAELMQLGAAAMLIVFAVETFSR